MMRNTLITTTYSLHVFDVTENLLYRSEPIPNDELPERLKTLKDLLKRKAYETRLKLMNLTTGNYEEKPI